MSETAVNPGGGSCASKPSASALGGFAAGELRKLGYEYVPGPTGDPSDYVLRQVGDSTKGFEWRGQENYDNLGEAVYGVIQAQLSVLCGLEALPLPANPASANSVVYATPDVALHTGPLLLLVCGAAPGGAAGIWGRNLCINWSLLEGAMFDYILRAKALGWAVVVANPHVKDVNGIPVPGSESPHVHVQTLWKTYLEKSACSSVLVVAHSYGGPCMVNLLKTEEGLRARIKALVLTDGSAFHGTIVQEAIPSVEEQARAPKPEAMKKLVEEMEAFAELAPEAFRPPSADVTECISRVGRNFVSSSEPLGTIVNGNSEGFPCVSAGHESHPSTTHAATKEVFAFLELGVEGKTAQANAELRDRAAAEGGYPATSE